MGAKSGTPPPVMAQTTDLVVAGEPGATMKAEPGRTPLLCVWNIHSRTQPDGEEVPGPCAVLRCPTHTADFALASVHVAAF